MDDLLIKYILEEATPAESEQVQQWLAADAANRAHFEKLQAVWQLASQPNLQPATAAPQALQRLKQTLKAREAAPIKRISPKVWAIAAMLAGITVMAIGAYILFTPNKPRGLQPGAQKPVQADTTRSTQPDTLLQKQTKADTTPAIQPAQTDTIIRPHKKKRPTTVPPVQTIRPKKKTDQHPTQHVDSIPVKKKHPVPPAAQPVLPRKKTGRQPTRPTDTIPVKKKYATPVKQVHPVRKHKSTNGPAAPPVKEPPIS